MTIFTDRKYRLPRVWSNRELEKFSHLFSGDVANVSGWKDIDKEGKHYKDYFINAKSYTITNYKTEARGFQGYEGEIFLDLEDNLPDELVSRFDVIFNHTVLEHIYEVHKAFKNLCLMTRDIVILIVPFLQQLHGTYGDYWRFSPLAINRMFEDNNMSLLYLSFNGHRNASVYTFSIATKNPSKWQGKIHNEFSYLEKRKPLGGLEAYIGCHAIQNFGYFLGCLGSRIIKFLHK